MCDLEGDEEDLQVIHSCAMPQAELRAQLATISDDQAWIDDIVALALDPKACVA